MATEHVWQLAPTLAAANWDVLFEYGGIGSLGAFVFIILRGYQLYGRLEEEKFKAMIGSWMAWTITILAIIACGVFTWVLYEDSESPKALHMFVAGAGAPALLNQAVSAMTANQPPVAGSSLDGDLYRFKLRDLFS